MASMPINRTYCEYHSVRYCAFKWHIKRIRKTQLYDESNTRHVTLSQVYEYMASYIACFQDIHESRNVSMKIVKIKQKRQKNSIKIPFSLRRETKQSHDKDLGVFVVNSTKCTWVAWKIILIINPNYIGIINSNIFKYRILVMCSVYVCVWFLWL